MSVPARAVFRAVAAAVAVGAVVVACERESPTSPLTTTSLPDGSALSNAVGTTPYPGTKSAGTITACKSSDSPAGTYTFTASASPTQSGDGLLSNFTLSPGTCKIVWQRPAADANATDVTITEVIPSGASYTLDHINAVDDANGNQNVHGPSVTFRVSGLHGAVATFYNVPAAPSGGHVILCKSGNVQGTFKFLVTATGTIAGDVVKSTTNLAAGSCDTVFVRAKAGPVAAVITITEDLGVNASTYLKGVTVDGKASVVVGLGVVVTENLTTDKVVVFTNAQVTTGLGLF